MTIMNWALAPESAALVSDTIATSWGPENAPCAIMQKVWIVPHLGLMIGAVNWVMPVMSFVNTLVNGELVPTDIEAAASMASELLPAFAAQLSNENAGAERSFSALLFGWSWKRDRCVGYKFQSPDGCRPIELPDAIGLSPFLPDNPFAEGKISWFDVARAQQARDHAFAQAERENLGGYVTLHELTRPAKGEGPAIISRVIGTLSGADGLIADAEQRHRQVSEALRSRTAVRGAC